MWPSNEAKLPSPWDRFLEELDGLFREQVHVHCIGGFVVSLFYQGLSDGEIVPSALKLERQGGRRESRFSRDRAPLSRPLVYCKEGFET